MVDDRDIAADDDRGSEEGRLGDVGRLASLRFEAIVERGLAHGRHRNPDGYLGP